MKKRHSKYCNWAKYLFETVHCFGKSKLNRDKHFYHGIDSMIYFTNSNINFNHPISTSGSIIVVTSYSLSLNNGIKRKKNDNGVVLRLIKSNNLDERDKMFKLHCFNCSMFSDFSFEDEYLFNGSWNGLQIDSIYDISSNRKYRSHLRSLRILDLMFRDFG